MQEIGKFNEYLSVIPTNIEKYLSFQIGKNLVFIDSFQFMASSLDRLAGNPLGDKFIYTSGEMSNINLLKRNGVYPYEYMDSFVRFEEIRLSLKDKFYSSLNDENISDSDYEHAVNVWNTFGCRNLGDYHDLYLKIYILLLADVFENFRKTCLMYYGLDPAYYFSAPGLAWDAMLKTTGTHLELISDTDMSHMIQSGMRGGISYISTRYSKANDIYMKYYDRNEEKSHIIYLDANNLYGWAKSRALPVGEFKRMTNQLIEKIDLVKYDNNLEKGLILEVDLEYQKELHELHNDYPLAPDKIPIDCEMLSPYCKNIAKKFGIKQSNIKKN